MKTPPRTSPRAKPAGMASPRQANPIFLGRPLSTAVETIEMEDGTTKALAMP
jgi:hypothetical protein